MIQPRILRQRDAPGYCGMDRNRFDVEVRPFITEIPIGVRGIAFDREELDVWLDEYIATHGRPARQSKGMEATAAPKLPPRAATRKGRREATMAALALSRSGAPKIDVLATSAPEPVEKGMRPRKKSNFERVMESCNAVTARSLERT